MKIFMGDSSKLTHDEKVFLAIERLIQGHIVSVNEETKKYCFKTLQGEVKTVCKKLIEDRILAKLF